MRLKFIFKIFLSIQVLCSFSTLADTCVFYSYEGISSKIVSSEPMHLNEIFALNTIWADPVDIEFWVEKCEAANDVYYSLITRVAPTIAGKSRGASHYDLIVIQNNKQFDGVVNYSNNLYIPTDTSAFLSNLTSPDLDLSQPFTLIFTCSNISANIYNACSSVNPEIHLEINPQASSQNFTISSVSGSWYDPIYNGSGYNVVQTPAGFLLYYYGYKANTNGEALWLISSLGPKTINKGEMFTLDMFSGFVGNGGSLTTKPNTVNSGTIVWGSAEVVFDTCNSGVIKLTNNNGINVTHNISLIAGIDEVECRE